MYFWHQITPEVYLGVWASCLAETDFRPNKVNYRRRLINVFFICYLRYSITAQVHISSNYIELVSIRPQFTYSM